MIFSENRCTLFRIMLYPIAATASISISQPGRIRRLTATNVLAGGSARLR